MQNELSMQQQTTKMVALFPGHAQLSSIAYMQISLARDSSPTLQWVPLIHAHPYHQTVTTLPFIIIYCINHNFATDIQICPTPL